MTHGAWGQRGRSKMVVWGQEVKEGGRESHLTKMREHCVPSSTPAELGPSATEGASRPLAQQDSGQAHKCVHQQ